MDVKEIDFVGIDKKWQQKWEKEKAFAAKEKGKKYYVLEMFAYPSGSGLHMGHAFNDTIGDVKARFMRMNGMNVLYPTGYDSFGLPAENAAIKANSHPKKFTELAINNFIEQQKSLGLSYDWSRMLKTSDPEYYKWNQYFFLKFLEKGLVYRKKASVNFCSKCNTVLANEQVHNGKCWRHPTVDVEIKQLEQWFIKTTDYAEELLKDIDKLEWPHRIKTMQKNWIGKSEGSEILFSINGEQWKVFTTRPDTLFGVTFLVISAQHSGLMELVTKDRKKDVLAFLKKIRSTKQEDMDKLDKEGVFTGSYAINPITKEKVPVWAGNFVVAEYGSGMVMAVPAHDQRDFEFAKKYKIPIKLVIQPLDRKLNEKNMKEAHIGLGTLVNSDGFDDLDTEEAKEHIIIALKEKKLGKKTIQYKLRDWLISRQRYWGTPIPVVYCENCGIVPVKEKDLPVLLPEKVTFGKGNPLAGNKDFVNVKCPKCGIDAKRETDTLDTFFDSSWYYLRFLDNKNNKEPFEKKKADYWMAVDQYIGGAEHANMHLIYARFFTKALRDLGYVKVSEPFIKLFNQGMIHGEDGFVMSKSRGNVVDPMGIIDKYGADTLRLFLMSMGSPDKDSIWSNKGVEGSLRFVRKVVNYFNEVKIGKSSKKVESKTNKAIWEITKDIESFRYNIAVIKLRQLFDSFESVIGKKDLESFLKIFSVFAPHISEELWEKIGNKGFVSLQNWPMVDEKKIDNKIEEAEENFEQAVNDINNVLNIINEKGGSTEKVFLYVLPNEKSIYDEVELNKKIGKPVKVFVVNDKDKHDPENKSKRAKPGKPAIYIE